MMITSARKIVAPWDSIFWFYYVETGFLHSAFTSKTPTSAFRGSTDSCSQFHISKAQEHLEQLSVLL